ncbi:hypothetical protein [Salipiger sp. IMCC34102]|uniref:hypothetical protein n=1 Tax=Salipiger sp. IMCC34102 TaxID=2510647 RepID=UPI001A9196F5|nr:hypothetical protein [Salipiger sp. IMCC34102]
MPNIFAYLVLASWPGVSLWLFARLSVERALIWTIVGGYMVLPPTASFDLPVVPALDKYGIANLSALMGCLIYAGRRSIALPRSPLICLLLAAFVFSPLATTLTNEDALYIGIGALPGLRLYDAASILVSQLLFVLPFFLAQNLLRTPGAHRDQLKIFIAGALIYSVPMLIEIRLSPQLNTWIYGFFQHSFAQMMRSGGFRPIVFMPHGLWLAFFIMTATVAAATLSRDNTDNSRSRWLLATGYLFVLLFLCKSLASLVYALVLLPLVLMAPVRIVLMTSLGFAAVALSYPILRGSDLVPVVQLLNWAESINVDRAQSLAFRFTNEDMLLSKANERPIFGWGTWGRNLIYDLQTGENISVTDGRWIIVIGTFGWLGYLAEFGLLTAPIFALFMTSRRNAIPAVVAATALLLGINLIDMLPNATLLPITWMMAGGLLGYVECNAVEEPNSSAPIPERSVIRPLNSIL